MNFLRMRFLSACFFIGIAAAAVAQQDVVTVGTVTANGSAVDVPVSIRDVSGTPLGIDRPAGSKIQAFSIKVTYAPASAVQSVTFSRAGITAGLNPTSEFSPSTPGAVSYLGAFQESTNPIPFTLNASPPGNTVAHLVFNLSASAAPGSSISLTLDSSLTQLTDDGGTAATKETTSNGTLALVDGSIAIPLPTLQLNPSAQDVTPGNSAFITATASANLPSDTTVTLSSSDPAVATVPSAVIITAGTKAATFSVNGIAVGSATITATLPPSLGSASATAKVNVVTGCAQPARPTITGPATADSGASYAISWAVVSGATDYSIDETTDANFGSGVTTKSVSTTSASFSHSTPGVRYYYRVRAHNGSGTCNVSSASSDAISVLINAAAGPTLRILAAVGSLPGANFKTSVQLYNPRSVAISGKIVFHTQNVSGSASDPSIAYSLQPRKTISYADLLPAMGIASGLGSADLIADATSPLPLALVRVYADGGAAAGTNGLTEELLNPDDALQQGNSGTLIAPEDVVRFRLNIGVRTLTQHVEMTITVRDKDGATVKTTNKGFDPTFFLQIRSSDFLDGYALKGGETITFDITSGSAFIYGATTDNVTNDPSVQFARRIE